MASLIFVLLGACLIGACHLHPLPFDISGATAAARSQPMEPPAPPSPNEPGLPGLYQQPPPADPLERKVSNLSDQVAAPPALTSVASLAREIESNKWEVPMGPPLSAFLYHSGPREVVRYNLQFVKRKVNAHLVSRAACEKAAAYNPADVYTLTEAGRQLLEEGDGDRRCVTWEQACTGRGAHGRDDPNCMRAQCVVGAPYAWREQDDKMTYNTKLQNDEMTQWDPCVNYRVAW